MFFKISALKNFFNIYMKAPVLESLFKNFIKKRLQYRCFPVNTAKHLRTAFLQNTSGICFCIFEIHFSKFRFRINVKLFSNTNNAGMVSYFLIAIFTRSEYSAVFEMLLRALMTNLFTASLKKSIRVSATFWSSEIIASFSIRVIQVDLGTLLERKGVIFF